MDASADDIGMFRDAVKAINFHRDTGCIPNKNGAVVKRQARWGNGSGASCPADREIWTDCLKPEHRVPANLDSAPASSRF